MVTLKCKRCGKEFKAESRSPRYCSEECRKISRKIAALGSEKPVGLEKTPNYSTMARQIIQDGDRWQ
jgi:hypothetical protein